MVFEGNEDFQDKEAEGLIPGKRKDCFYREMAIPVQSRHAPAEPQEKATNETEAATTRRAGHSGNRTENLQAASASDIGHTQSSFTLRLTGTGVAGALGNPGGDVKASASARARSGNHKAQDIQTGTAYYPRNRASV